MCVGEISGTQVNMGGGRDNLPNPHAEELQTRTRRKQFYLKNGFCETGIFTKADGGIDYEIICFSIRKELRDGEAACAMRNIYETFFAEGEYAVYEN